MMYQEIAAIYDARAAIPFDGHSNQREVNASVSWVLNQLSDTATKICDVGCNAAWHIEEFYSRGYHSLHGIDLSQDALRSGLERIGKKVKLTQGNVAYWEANALFDVVTNFNSCLGAGDRSGDREFLKGICRILRKDGLLFLTYLSVKNAKERVGDFDVQYDRKSAIRVRSRVSIDRASGEFTIEQLLDGSLLPTERFSPYPESEACALLALCGFEVVSEPKFIDDLPGVTAIVARKR